jgi:hypothetical protein
MANLHLITNLETNNEKYHVGLSLIEFIEDDVTIVYSPALDLSGYGNNEIEAKQSFSEAIDEFFRFITEENTFDKVLTNLGWTINSSIDKMEFNPPKDSDLVASNSLYNEIVNNKSYKVSRQELEFSL